MSRRPPGSTRTDTFFPYTTLFPSLRTVARLFPRYAGDPCVGATNSATIAQCTAQGYRGPYDSNNPANLQGGYFFGGNANIEAERGKTYTLGGVFTPTFLRGLNLSVDWYKDRKRPRRNSSQ